MAELVSSVAANVLEKLGSIVGDEISLAWGMKEDLKKLEETTTILQTVLEDAENKQHRDKQLNLWLVRLKDVLDDAVDVIDEFECETLRRQVVKQYGSLGRKVRRFFSRSNPLAFRFSIAHQMKQIRQRLDDISKEMSRFQLIAKQVNNDDQSHTRLQGTRQETHSFVDPSEVIGREKDKAKIIAILTEHEKGGDDNLSVIPIVGLGGLGKTMLAKSVYNDESVISQFGLRLWVCLPMDFNFSDAVKEILKSVISATYLESSESFTIDRALRNTKDLSSLSTDQLQMFLRGFLKDKKIFLVLDDVWSEDQGKWNELRGLLSSVCAKGSKIIVTTRSTKVAIIMGTTLPHSLASLSEEDSLSLFLKYAFGDQQLAEKFPKLKDIGRQIVKKCKGVPLALKCLGSLLYSKRGESEWITLRDNEIWELEKEDNDPIFSALRLSYNAMSPLLKQCFVYCSLSPKNIHVNNRDMISMWMALGAIRSPNDKMEMEDVGTLCFGELCARSFFQYLDDAQENWNIYQYFEMHDLIHDLATSIIQNEHSIVNSSTTSIHENTRYLTMLMDGVNAERVQGLLHKCKKVKAFFTISNIDEPCDIDESFICTCFSTFTLLRIVDFFNASFDVLPSSIGKLKHLRYLNLSANKRIKKLPDSICNLQSLQTLLFQGCEELEELPKGMRNLVSLRTLSLTTKQTYLLENGIGRLKSLHTLIIVDCKNLRSLPHDMRYCTTLRVLVIGYCEQLELASGKAEIEFVTELSLQTLLVAGLPQTTGFPDWLQGASHSLQQLGIGDILNLLALPDKLASLEMLLIEDCPNLQSLPDGMQCLTNLTIVDCPILERRCDRESGEDWPKIAHVPDITIHGSSADD